TRDGGVDLPVGETGDGLAGEIPHLHREQCRHRTVTMSEWSVTRCTMNPTELAPVRHIVRGRGDRRAQARGILWELGLAAGAGDGAFGHRTENPAVGAGRSLGHLPPPPASRRP